MTTPLTIEQAQLFLENHHQKKLWATLSSLPPSLQTPLLRQLSSLSSNANPIPFPSSQSSPLKKITPFTTPLKEEQECTTIGTKALKEGRVVSLMLAGGDGTRLKFHQPKGCFETSLIMKKSLFELHCEKIVALQKQLSCSLPLMILTSPHNHDATLAFFKKHQFFNLTPSQVTFLTQPIFPLYNTHHEWFFKNSAEIATGPNGNGGLLQALHPFLEKLGPHEHLIIFNVDNALACPYDASLIGAHIHHQAEASLRCFKHNPKKDKVGVLANIENRLAIIDYTSLQNPSSFPYGNMNLLCFSLSFIKDLCTKHSLPVHWIEKKGHSYNYQKQTSDEILTLRGEKFITDAIFFAKKTIALNSQAEEHFSPLKNLQGINDIASVQQDLLRKDQSILHQLTGLPTENHRCELSMDFHYPTESLLKKCIDLKTLPQHPYISFQSLT